MRSKRRGNYSLIITGDALSPSRQCPDTTNTTRVTHSSDTSSEYLTFLIVAKNLDLGKEDQIDAKVSM